MMIIHQTTSNHKIGAEMKSTMMSIFPVVTVPAIALIGSLASYSFLTHKLHLISQGHSLESGMWWEALSCAVAFTLCSIVFLWWFLSMAVSSVLAIKAKLQGRERVSLPSWAPMAVKATVTGLFGLGLLSNPALAATIPAVQPLSSVTQVQQHKQQLPLGLFLRPSDDTFGISPAASPLFSYSRSTTLIGEEGGQVEVTVTKASQRTQLSPLFGGLRKSVEAPRASSQDTDPGAPVSSRVYIIQPGDTLWSIAEQHLPATASGSEVLNLVHTIQSANVRDIPTLESFIYPGQSITLPF